MSLLCNFSEAPALIKEKLVLSSVIEAEGVLLKKQGREWIGLCPFHQEKTPSFYVNDDKGVYLCRGCGATGDVITFVAQRNGRSDGQVIRSLANQIGYTIRTSTEWKSDQNAKRPVIGSDDKTKLADLHDHIAQIAHRNLVAIMNQQSHPLTHYLLRDRGISLDLIEQYGLGYLPPESDLYSLARSPGPTNPEPTEYDRQHWETLATEAGLLRSGRNRSLFQGRLLFPITSPDGKCIAFSGRVVPGYESSTELADRKYINSSATLLFDKSKTLYGQTPLAWVKDDKRLSMAWRERLSSNEAVLVEGLTDVLRLAGLGIFAVAAMGTAITEHQLRLLFRQNETTIVLTDGDKAGLPAARRTLIAGIPLLVAGKRFFAAVLPDGEDPDTYFRQVTKSNAQDALTGLPRLQPEGIWFEEFIKDCSDPISLSDQITIERALAGADDIPLPADSFWLIAFHRYVEEQTGYVTKPYSHTRGLGLPAALSSQIISEDTSAFWLYRTSRFPALLNVLTPFKDRWWVRDAVSGLLSHSLECPPALRVLYTAHSLLLNAGRIPAEKETWDTLASHLIEAGFSSSLLIPWNNLAYDTDRSLAELGYIQEVFAPDLWEHELSEWLTDVDDRLTRKLVQAVASA